jgi:hypothetical protein
LDFKLEVRGELIDVGAGKGNKVIASPLVAVMPDGKEHLISRMLNREIAQQIALAVNAYDGLLAALETATSFLMSKTHQDSYEAVDREVVDQMTSAIAKAKQE